VPVRSTTVPDGTPDPALTLSWRRCCLDEFSRRLAQSEAASTPSTVSPAPSIVSPMPSRAPGTPTAAPIAPTPWEVGGMQCIPGGAVGLRLSLSMGGDSR
jgi:hypothetical protein